VCSLVRFIRARKGDYAETKLMLEDHFKWRAKYNVDEILDNPPAKMDIMRKLWGGTVHKEDRELGPVLIVPYGYFLTSGTAHVLGEFNVVRPPDVKSKAKVEELCALRGIHFVCICSMPRAVFDR